MVLAFVTSRLLIICLIVLSRMVVIGGEFSHGGGWMSVLTQGEGEAHVHIAQHGYALRDQQFSVGLFPVYHWLVWFVALVLRDYGIAAVATANAALLGAGLLMNALINLDHRDPRLNKAAAAFLMFSPTSFFFTSAYPESTLLMFSLAAVLAARKQNWLVACLCGLGAAGSRNVGVAILVPLLMEYLRPLWADRKNARALLHPRVLLFLLVPLGTLYHLWEGYWRLADPWLYWHAKLVWGGRVLPPRRALLLLKALPPFYLWFSSVALVSAVLLLISGAFQKIRRSYLAYAAVLIAFAFCTNTPEALPRFLGVIFPLCLILAALTARARFLYEPLVVAFIVALSFCTILAASGYWMV